MTTALTTQQIVDTYGAAWGEPDVDKRRALLEQAWADDATYTDPQFDVSGRDGLIELISGFQAQVNGAKIVPTSAVDVHHDKFRFTWAMQSAEGASIMEGIDYGELAPDGRIQKIVGFFGPPPVLQEA
jgi:hypothetical protein